MVSKVEDPSAWQTSHGDKVSHVSLDVDLASFQTGHRSPRLGHGARIQQTKWSIYRITESLSLIDYICGAIVKIFSAVTN